MKKFIGIVIGLQLLIIGLFLHGCVLPGMIQIAATASPVSTNITETALSTNLPTPSPTRTPTDLLVEKPSATPSPTGIPKRTTEFVREKLDTDEECILPCWWGITPGETSWTALTTRFAAAGLVIEDGRLDLSPWEDITGHRITVEFQRNGDTIEQIQIQCELDPVVIFVDGMVDVCGEFALSTTLGRFGVPTHVNLSMSRLDSLYDLWTTYESSGVTISYPGIMIADVEGWYICPVHSRQGSIDIYLHSPGIEPSGLGFGSSDGVFIAGGDLELLTGVSAGEFHTIFSTQQSRSCLFAGEAFQRYYDEILVPPDGSQLWPQTETDILMEMLNTDQDCDAPCWWGIIPGKTNWEEAKDHFLSLGKSIAIYSDNTLNLGGVRRVAIFGRHDPNPFEYMLEHEIYESGGRVYMIGARTQTFGGQPFGELLQDWNRYSVSHTLARYGIPSEVLLHYWSNDPGAPYMIGLVYEREGVLVEYQGLVKLLPETIDENNDRDERVVICLDPEHISGINVWIRTPWGSTAMSDVFKHLGGNFPKNFYSTPTLEESTGMSLVEFNEKFLKPRPETCLVADIRLGDLME